MPRILILADDLTGAADCGVAFVSFGLRANVSLGEPQDGIDTDVLAVDADTRSLSHIDAAESMHRLVIAHGVDPSTLLFKKIDSTLRGHLEPEISAVLSARRLFVPDAIAIVAVSFPSSGRITRHGVVYVHGEPLHETETWRSEGLVGEAHIPTLLGAHGLRCAHLDLECVRSESGAFRRAALAATKKHDVVLCDAVTDDDLLAVGLVAATLERRVIWIGSAGLAHQLPRALGLVLKFEQTALRVPPTTGPALFVIGSVSGATRDQVAAVLAASNMAAIVVPPSVLLAERGSDWHFLNARLRNVVTQGEDAILLCGTEPRVDAADRCRLSAALADMTAPLHSHVGALVASGGETARKVLDRWSCTTLLLHGELECGVPVSSTFLPDNRPLTVITKAGGFGPPDTLVRCYEWLKKEGSR